MGSIISWAAAKGRGAGSMVCVERSSLRHLPQAVISARPVVGKGAIQKWRDKVHESQLSWGFGIEDPLPRAAPAFLLIAVQPLGVLWAPI